MSQAGSCAWFTSLDLSLTPATPSTQESDSCQLTRPSLRYSAWPLSNEGCPVSMIHCAGPESQVQSQPRLCCLNAFALQAAAPGTHYSSTSQKRLPSA